MLRALIFDLDGTLIKLTLPLEAMRRDTKEYFIKHGLPAHLLDRADGINSTTIKAKKYFLSLGLSTQEWEYMQNSVDDILAKLEIEAANKTEAIEGVHDTIECVRALGIKTAILTNNARDAVIVILKHLPFSELFDVIQTRHESPNPKPFPDGLISISQKLGVELDEAVYVGDAVIDAVAAQRAGIEFWGVTTGSATKEDLQSVGAKVILNSFDEIPSMIKSRMKGIKNS
jgi:HAD superfamily hydrolase (TIGR01549 family)